MGFICLGVVSFFCFILCSELYDNHDEVLYKEKIVDGYYLKHECVQDCMLTFTSISFEENPFFVTRIFRRRELDLLLSENYPDKIKFISL